MTTLAVWAEFRPKALSIDLQQLRRLFCWGRAVWIALGRMDNCAGQVVPAGPESAGQCSRRYAIYDRLVGDGLDSSSGVFELAERWEQAMWPSCWFSFLAT